MLGQKDRTEIRKCVRSGTPYSVTTATLPHETELQLEEILSLFLEEIGRGQLKDSLGYCLRELAVNAKKANTKRVYFTSLGLDISNPGDYTKGMQTFKRDTLGNIQHYLPMMDEQGYYIRISFTMKGTTLVISIANNTEMTQKEQIRVFDRIARSRAYNSLQEAMEQAIDESEGAGLGIIILVLMLRKIGLSEEAFELDVENGETVVRLSIPLEETKQGNLETIAREIVNEVDSLPQFPENIAQLQRLLQDPKIDLQTIARKVSTDPALTADLLKIVNSAQYMLPKRIDNILEAVKLIGLRGVQNLVYSYGSIEVLDKDTPRIQQLWSHSYRTAFFAYQLAKSSGRREILDDAYVGGILHDIGKILFSTSHEPLMQRISDFCTERKLPISLLEELAAGFNHSEVGAMIAEKWNFPQPLIHAIRFQHAPEQAPPRYYEVTAAVYLANAACEYETGSLPYVFIDQEILNDYGIGSETELQAHLARMSSEFSKESV
ncbi:HDOD domain-containing protein [Spirochaeta africana]|uniref:Putative domain HDIG-containing protein n=1 Tax=Spirochaeta africana (strain ATCC 700263 / DSM 8902 / Z-7692) TaxID=889378 RepID=H9UFP2_SPIAZ|nr:HDOD domain-containing protein [Spirochaeta africana]AFG36335.1 putative domain HDIG-containing protein [Spirochaeta africana DSM 8902]